MMIRPRAMAILFHGSGGRASWFTPSHIQAVVPAKAGPITTVAYDGKDRRSSVAKQITVVVIGPGSSPGRRWGMRARSQRAATAHPHIFLDRRGFSKGRHRLADNLVVREEMPRFFLK